MKATIVSTKEEVEVLWYGFELVVVESQNGHQQMLVCSEVGLPNRQRPIPNKK